MYKKIICLFALCALVLTLSGCSGQSTSSKDGSSTNASQSGEDAADDRYFDDPISGLRFRLPDAWYEALYEKYCLVPSDSTGGFSLDYLTVKGREELEKLMDGQDEGKELTPEQQEEMENILLKNIIPLCGIMVLKDGEKDEALRSKYTSAKILGKKNGTEYTLLTSPDIDLSALSDEDRETYKTLLESAAEFDKDMTLSGKQDMLPGNTVSFNSQTLSGEKISSTGFKDHKLTMINIWSTWCGPCIKELPELQKLYKELPEGVNLLGICTDAEEEAELAKNIVSKQGVKYKTVVANQKMLKGFLANIQSYPTTIFVDSQGNMIGEPVLGVPSGDVVASYRAMIEERLALLGQQ